MTGGRASSGDVVYLAVGSAGTGEAPARGDTTTPPAWAGMLARASVAAAKTLRIESFIMGTRL